MGYDFLGSSGVGQVAPPKLGTSWPTSGGTRMVIFSSQGSFDLRLRPLFAKVLNVAFINAILFF